MKGDTAPITAEAVDVPAAARMLGLSERTVWRMVDAGELPSFKARGARRIALADIRTKMRADNSGDGGLLRRPRQAKVSRT